MTMWLALLAQEAQDPPQVQLTWPAIAGGLAAITVILGAAVAVIRVAWRRARRSYQQLQMWVERTATSAATAAAAVKTSNGRSTGQLVESTAGAVDRMATEISVLTDWAGENRDLARQGLDTSQKALATAERAEALAQRALERLDDHLLGHWPAETGG